jgi:20S proteasome alpha/beta subunit
VSIENIPKRKNALSIVAGFKCPEGIVLCADTQETTGVAKRSIPKLRFEPSGTPQIGEGLAVAFCGAGDNGAFIDRLVQNAWEDAQLGTNAKQVCEIIQNTIESTYKKYKEIYGAGCCPMVDLVYGVKMSNECRLFSASGAVVNERESYDSFGAGQYMADFLKNRMYNRYLNLRQCAILAAYILFQAKEHVDGCGGESHIAILRGNGPSGMISQIKTNALTKLLGISDYHMSTLLLDYADIELPYRSLAEMNQTAIQIIESARTSTVDELDQHEKHMAAISGSGKTEVDFFGFPVG